MNVLACDLATNSGFCLYNINESHLPTAARKVWSFRCGGKDTPMIEMASLLAGHLITQLKTFRKLGLQPIAIILEEPYQHITLHKNTKTGAMVPMPKSSLLPHQLAGAVAGVARGFGIPGATVPIATWRKSVYGFARREGWDRAKWKKHAVAQCDLLGISVGNDDEAEAVMIALYSPNHQHIKAAREGWTPPKKGG